MACKTKENTIKKLIEKGVISDTRTILNRPEFDKLNITYTNLAKTKYGVEGGMLFSVEEKNIPRSEKPKRPSSKVERAIPNEELFTRIDAIINEEDVKEVPIAQEKLEPQVAYQNVLIFKKKQSVKTEEKPLIKRDIVYQMRAIMNILGISEQTVDKLYNEQQEINRLEVEYASSANIEERAALKKQIEVLQSKGVDEETVAVADLLNRVIQFVHGEMTEDNFTEEVVHFIVDILEKKDPSLYKQLFDRITRFDTYGKILNAYKGDSQYQTEDGRPDFNKIKKEAIGQVLVDFLLNFEENFNESDTNLNFIQFIWNKITDFIKSLFGKAPIELTEPFQYLAESILNNPEFISPEDVRYIGGETFKSRRITEKSILSKFKKAIAEQISGAGATSAKVLDELTRKKFSSNEEMRNHFESFRESIEKTEDEADHYILKGEFKLARVTSVLSKASSSLYKNITKDEEAELLRKSKAEKGSAVHKDIEDILSRYIDKSTGLRKGRKEIPPRSPGVATSFEIYNKLEDQIATRLASYPDGTRFSFELPIANVEDGYAGTIDFIAYLPDMSIDILDWKTNDVYYFDDTKGKMVTRVDVSPFNQKSWKKQLTLYKNALYKNGVRKFRYTRAIPIATKWGKEKIDPTKKWTPANTEFILEDVEVGDVDISKISRKKNYLLPVSIETEKTNNPDLDKLLKKLWAVRDKIEKSTYKDIDRDKKYLELETIATAIRELQMRRTAYGLSDVFNSNFKRFRALADFEPDFLNEIKPNQSFIDPDTAEKIEDYLEELRNADEFLSVFDNFSETIRAVYGKKITEEEKKLLDDITETELSARRIQKDISNRINEATHKLGESLSIMDVTSEDFQFKFTYLTSLLSREEKSLQYTARLLNTVQAIQHVKIRELYEELKKHRDAVKAWAKSSNKSVSEAWNLLADHDKLRLIAKVKKDFYTELSDKREEFQKFKKEELTSLKDRGYKGEQLADKLAKSTEKFITPWLSENIDLAHFKKEYEERRLAYIENLDERKFSEDEIADLEKKTSLLQWWERQNNVLLYPEALRDRNFLLKVQEDKWLSDEYKVLLKTENKPLLDAYNFFIGLNVRAKKSGMMDDIYNANRFIPQIAKNDLAYGIKKTFGQILSPLKTIRYVKSMFVKNVEELAEDEIRSADVDPITGKQRLYIPVFYKKIKEGDEQDPDLLKNFAKWAEHIAKYETVADFENRFNIIRLVENMKEEMVKTSLFGTPLTKNSGLDIGDETELLLIDKISTTEKDLESFINNYVYNTGQDVTPVIKKLLNWLYTYTQYKFLSLNITANITNYIGGRLQRGLRVENYATKNDLRVADLIYAGIINKYTEAVFGKQEDIREKALYMIDFFGADISDNRELIKREFSTGTFLENLSFPNLTMFGFKMGDEAIQKPIAIAVLMNTALVDNKIVNIPTFVRNQYPGYFSKTPAEQKALRKQINKEIEEMKKTKSLFTLIEEKDGNFVIKGIDPSTTEGQDHIRVVRNLARGVIKDTLGNASQSDMSAARLNFFTQPFLQFKNWLPRLFAVRFGSSRYDWEKGQVELPRVTTLFNAFAEMGIIQSLKLISLTLPLGTIRRRTGVAEPVYTEKDIQNAAKEAYINMKEYYAKRKDNFEVSEEEFVNSYLTSVDSAFRELNAILNIIIIFALASELLGGNDRNKWYMRALAKLAFKVKQEITFAYSPESQLYGIEKAVPIVSTLGDLWALLGAIVGETSGIVLEVTPVRTLKRKGRQLRKSSKPLYRATQSIPGAREVNFWLMARSKWWADEVMNSPQPKTEF